MKEKKIGPGGPTACTEMWRRESQLAYHQVMIAESTQRPQEGSGEVCSNQITVELIDELESILVGKGNCQ